MPLISKLGPSLFMLVTANVMIVSVFDDWLSHAVQANALDKKALAAIHAYNPGLSAAWMFQRSMSVRPDHRTTTNFINRLLGVNFRSMYQRGDWVLKPFMQVSIFWCRIVTRCCGASRKPDYVCCCTRLADSLSLQQLSLFCGSVSWFGTASLGNTV